MGQIESNGCPNPNNTLITGHNQIDSRGGSDASNVDKNYFKDMKDSTKDKVVQNEQVKDQQEDPRVKKAKTYDFACTVFYAMVAMLVLSTMSRTYTTYHGSGSCGAMYGIQYLLAYTCVGLACAIIRKLRKHIKQQIEDLSPEVQAGTEEEERDEHNSMSYHRLNEKKPLPVPWTEHYGKEKVVMEKVAQEREVMDKVGMDDRKADGLIIDMSGHQFQPYSGQDRNKLSTGLPLPSLPPLNSLSKQLVPNSETKGFSVLSAVDLKAIDTDVAKDVAKDREPEYHYPMFDNNEFMSNKEDQSQVSGSHKVKDRNWSDYNLNAIDKYM